jgi:hypothetical protein
MDNNIYNFDKTGFIIEQIAPGIIIMHVDRRGKNKTIQLDNRE